jgi:hypothetical protein
MGFKVMQIEVSNFCSLTCWYCPHPSQSRPKGDMSLETFMKCMELVKRSDNPARNGRKFVWLNHFGEPLLNPLLPDLISHARDCSIEVSFSSCAVDENKEFFPRELWQRLADAGLERVVLSAHVKNEKAMRAHVGDIVRVENLWRPRKENFHDWAGQVDMSRLKLPELEKPSRPCDYDLHNMFAVTWDGHLAACCYDIEGRVGWTVDDVLANGFTFREISLCANCRLGRGDVAWI